MHLLLLPLISLVPLALASPPLKRQNPPPPPPSSCIRQEWAVRGFELSTGPRTNELSFTFYDPNTNVSSLCDRSVVADVSAQSLDDPVNFYECANGAMRFRYAGSELVLGYSFECGAPTVTAQGKVNLNLICYPLNGGTQCEEVTAQINVIPEITT